MPSTPPPEVLRTPRYPVQRLFHFIFDACLITYYGILHIAAQHRQSVSLYAMADTKAAREPHETQYSTYKHSNVACNDHKDLYPALHGPFWLTSNAERISA